MIGAAVLAIGLLLVVAGLASARIPGRAAFARPGIDHVPGSDERGTRGVFGFAGRASNPILAFLLSPIHPATWYANGAVLVGLFTGTFFFAAIAALLSTGLTTLLAGVGVLFLAAGIEGARVIARIERRRTFAGEVVRPLAHPYRPWRGGFVAALRAEFLDEARWRDVLYVGINFPLVVIEFVVVVVVWSIAIASVTSILWYDTLSAAVTATWLGPLSGHEVGAVALRVGLGVALLPVAASLSQLVLALHRGVVISVLCTSESRELRRQVEVLQKSRSAVLDVEASELVRIERDLHDGAQQRLVMLSIDLGLASERLDDDPVAAKQLILDGQDQARQALAEIRQLVRGIAPSILLDRGLVAALESVSARGSVPIAVVSNLPPGERLPIAIERVAYFVATEALANIAKHSGASRCEVRCRREGSNLIIEIWDDGQGGAGSAPGGGLAGLDNRVAGVDGTFTVSSPSGGPTLIRAEIPIPPLGS